MHLEILGVRRVQVGWRKGGSLEVLLHHLSLHLDTRHWHLIQSTNDFYRISLWRSEVLRRESYFSIWTTRVDSEYFCSYPIATILVSETLSPDLMRWNYFDIAHPLSIPKFCSFLQPSETTSSLVLLPKASRPPPRT